jgi:two-component system, OmpR family, sensor histidine kinase KdpD
MTNERPDPDVLLARVERERAKARRGRLKIFFGAAAGVGKTYAMLLAAREKREEGLDVVIGIVETHKRVDTAALLEGLEVLPLRKVDYRGAELREFDLDVALARTPAIIVVDELAHTNAPGSRHPKRWNDVQELLAAGIDVYTAVNVQHLESLKDVVAGITGVQVAETVPDTVFDEADEVELVDLPPDELLERLREGKVYLPQQAERAIRNFFRKGNLIALREMSLRRTAERVEDQMRDYREGEGIRDIWQAADRILVCIGPGPLAEQLVRAGRRLAAALHAEWTVAYVETPKLQRLPAAARDEVLARLRLAERLGATTVTLSGHDMAVEILDYARRHNTTKIVLGSPTRRGWTRWLLGSVVDAIVRQAGHIDVHLMGAQAEGAARPAQQLLARSRIYLGVERADRPTKLRYPGYLWSLATTAACTALAGLMTPRFELTNVVMVYLLGVVIVAMRFGRGPSVLASIASVAAFDFFFVPPYLTFAVSDTQYLITFAVMLVTGLVISGLAASMRRQTRVARYREQRIAALFEMSRELAATRGEQSIIAVGVRHIAEVFQSQAVVLLPNADGRIEYPRAVSVHGSLHGADLAVAQWVYDHSQAAGLGTDTLPSAEAHYVPLAGGSGCMGVLALQPANLRLLFVPEQQRLLETFTSQIANSLERVRLATHAQDAELRMESERLRNALLSAISHDLRTPLAAILGASSTLLTAGERVEAHEQRELLQSVHDEAERMSGIVTNVLDMARLQAGAVRLNLQWYPMEEVVGGVLTKMSPRLVHHPVHVTLQPGLPLVQLDATLIERLLANLLENAVKYTPHGTPLEIAAEAGESEITVSVSDRGPGIPAGEEERVFEKFYRVAEESAQSGAGLGLAICRAIVTAHGGTINARNQPGGGAIFSFSLPLSSPPTIEAEPKAEQVP